MGIATGSSSTQRVCSKLYAPSGSVLHKRIMVSAERSQTGVSLKQLVDTGKGRFLPLRSLQNPFLTSEAQLQIRLQIAQFLYRELPIRLAHRVRHLESVPVLLEQPSVALVHDWYAQSYEEIVESVLPSDEAEEGVFADFILQIYERHAAVLLTMARGVWELCECTKKANVMNCDFYDSQQLHAFLDSFYMSRIGIRILIGHYLAVREHSNESGWVGLVYDNTSPASIAEQAIRDATFVCERQYGASPEVSLHGRMDLHFAYIPSHLHYILLELIKNSMRATIDFHGIENVDEYPIRIVIADGEANEDVVIKVTDIGGGIRRSHMPRIWSYLFTTADPSVQAGFMELPGVKSDHAKESPLAGLGYGLPISRAYARYFGGDLSVVSMEGYGTDTFVHLSRLGHHVEPLP
eukprot:7970_1